MGDSKQSVNTGAVPARFLGYESRALSYRSDARRLVRALLVTTLVCGGLAVVAFLVGERRIIEWASRAVGEDAGARTVVRFVCRAPRFLFYVVFALFLYIGFDRKQRFWVAVALIVLCLQLVVAGAGVRIIKWIVGRARPNIAPGFHPFSFLDDHQSFPSGETADIAASVSFFLYFAKKPVVRVVMLVAMALVIFERLMQFEHHPSDVLASAWLVLVVSFIVWHWFVVGFPVKKVRQWLGQDEAPHGAEVRETQQ